MERKRAGIGVLLLIGLLSLSASAQQDPDDGQVYTEKVEDSVINEINQLIREKRWRELFQVYRARLRTNIRKLVKSPTDAKREINFVEFLMARFAELPKEAFDAYRVEFNGPLLVEAERAEKENDLRRLESAVEMYFFAREADVHADRIANLYFEQGLWANAAKHWRRILKYYPDSKLDKSVVAAKLAYSASLLQSESQIQEAKQLIASLKIEGSVVIGEDTIKLADWAKEVKPVAIGRSATRPSLPPPYLKSRYENLMGEAGVPTTEMKRGAFTMGQPVTAQGMRVKVAPPYFPAFTECGGRRFLIFSDGTLIRTVDPERISLLDPKAGVFWEDESYKPQAGRVVQPRPQQEMQMRYFGPLIGCVVDGDDVYANMLSPREVDTAPANPNFGMPFKPMLVNSIRKYRLVDGNRIAGRLLKSTDDTIFTKTKTRTLEFVKDRFYFSYPMVISDDKIFVGVVAEGQAEQESYVVCLDKETLDIVWHTFVCAARTGANMWGWQNGMDYTIYPTLVSYANGLVYAQTNLGAVAGLDPNTGNLLWITTYGRETQPNMRRMGMGRNIERPANPPMVYRNRLYALPMDAKELLILDSASGDRIPTFDLPSSSAGGDDRRMDWKDLHYLIGFREDMVLLSGSQGLVALNVGPGKIEPIKSLWSHGSPEDGRPFLLDRYIYIPVSGTQQGLRIYDTPSFKLVDNKTWPEGPDWGNVGATNDYLFISGSERMTVWTTSKFALRQLELKTSQGPADPELLYKYGLDLMRSYESRQEVMDLRRARDRLSTFIYLAGTDKQYAEPVRDARMRLFSVYTNLGDHARRSTRYAEAIESYNSAKEFAYSAQTIAEVDRSLAETYVLSGQPKKAVDEYVDIMKRARDAYFKQPESNTFEPAWRYSRKQIEELSKKFGPQVNEYLEGIVGKALKDVGDNVEEMLKVMETYPVTQSVKDAMSRLNTAVESIKDPQRRMELMNRIRTTYPEIFKSNFYKPLLKTLEELGDFKRMIEELKKFRSSFGTDVWEPGAAPITVKQYCDSKIREIDAKLNASVLRITEKIEQVGRLGTPNVQNSATVGSAVPAPLRPLGIEPPTFGAHRELIAYGSSIELWNLRENKVQWTVTHPGSYIGITYQADANGYVLVTKVVDDSMAAKAGVKPNDIIRSINGRMVRADDIYSVLMRFEPGQTVKFGLMSNNSERTVDVQMEPMTAPVKYRIVFSAFTRDYRLIVGWDDLVACVDLETGKTKWVFDDIRETATIVAGHALEGRVMLVESENNRSKHPFRENLQANPSPTTRVITLGDSAGDIVKIQTMGGEGRGNTVTEARFYGEPFMDGAFLFVRGTQTAVMWVRADGDIARTNVLPSTRLWAETYDADLAAFFFSYQDDPTGEKWVKAYRQDKELWSVNVRDLGMMDGQRMMLEANEDYVAVALSSPNMSQMAILNNKGQTTGKTVQLPESSVVTTIHLKGPLVFLYAAEVPRAGGGSRNRSAYLCCYNLTGQAADPLWKTRAAFTTPNANVARMVEIAIEQDLVVLMQSQAYSEHEKGYGPVIGIYSRRGEGKLLSETLGWERGTMVNYSPTLHRGRLYTLERTANGQGVVLGTPLK